MRILKYFIAVQVLIACCTGIATATAATADIVVQSDAQPEHKNVAAEQEQEYIDLIDLEKPSEDLLTQISRGECPSSGILPFTIIQTINGTKKRPCEMWKTAALHNIPLVTLAWGQTYHWWNLHKFDIAIDLAKKLPKDCILMFNDGLDVLYAAGIMEIKKKFLESGKKIMFSGECGCYPQCWEKGKGLEFGLDYCLTHFPQDVKSEYRYLNTGQWIGYAEEVEKFFTKAINTKPFDEFWWHNDDQALLTTLWEEKQIEVDLDYGTSVFQSLHPINEGFAGSVPSKTCRPMKHLHFNEDSLHYYNNHTESAPAVFHYNGGNTAAIPEMYNKIIKKFRLAKLDQVGNMYLRFANDDGSNMTAMTVKEACGDLFESDKP